MQHCERVAFYENIKKSIDIDNKFTHTRTISYLLRQQSLVGESREVYLLLYIIILISDFRYILL